MDMLTVMHHIPTVEANLQVMEDRGEEGILMDMAADTAGGGGVGLVGVDSMVALAMFHFLPPAPLLSEKILVACLNLVHRAKEIDEKLTVILPKSKSLVVDVTFLNHV